MLDVSFFLLGLNVNAYVLPNGVEPIIVSDFKNGVYTVNGSPVALSDMWYDNPDEGNGYDPSHIEAGVGLHHDAGTTGPTLNDTLFADFAATAFTAVGVINLRAWDAATQQCTTFSLDDAPTFAVERDFNVVRGFGVPLEPHPVLSSNSGFTQLSEPDTVSLGLIRFAFNSTPDHLAMSINGLAVTAMADAISGYTHFYTFLRGQSTLEWFAIYALQADADLPTLSAH